MAKLPDTICRTGMRPNCQRPHTTGYATKSQIYLNLRSISVFRRLITVRLFSVFGTPRWSNVHQAMYAWSTDARGCPNIEPLLRKVACSIGFRPLFSHRVISQSVHNSIDASAASSSIGVSFHMFEFEILEL